jgi:hypothetical protein
VRPPLEVLVEILLDAIIKKKSQIFSVTAKNQDLDTLDAKSVIWHACGIKFECPFNLSDFILLNSGNAQKMY